jgi:multidrug efflux system membrane fusion protein
LEGRVAKILFTPGGQVRAGQLLVQLNDAPEQGDLERLTAQRANAKALLERTRRLLPQQAATQEQLEQAQAAFDQASGDLRRAQAVLEQKRIKAPFDGVLGIRRVNLGQFVRAGDALVSLTDSRTLFANLTLPETALPMLQRNQQVALSVDAYPGRVFQGRLSTIEPQIGSDTRTVRLQATIDNADGALTPGMFVNGKVALPALTDAITVPETAITYSTHGDSVFVVRPAEKGDGFTAQQVFVKAGERQDGLVVIETGLAPGDKVVTSGQLRLYTGAAVMPTAKDTLALAQEARP